VKPSTQFKYFIINSELMVIFYRVFTVAKIVLHFWPSWAKVKIICTVKRFSVNST